MAPILVSIRPITVKVPPTSAITDVMYSYQWREVVRYDTAMGDKSRIHLAEGI